MIGNHERRVAGVIRGTSQPAWSQKQSLSMIPEGEHADWASWPKSLPAVIETPHAIVTHARLDPTRSLTDQDAYHTAAVGGALVTIDLDGDGVTVVVFPGGDIVQVPVSRNHHDEAYKARRAAQRTLVGDSLSWTLAQALSVLNAQEDDPTDWAAEIEALNHAIPALGIEERGRRLQAQLWERLGNIPPPGPARGEYFKTVKNALPDWGSRNLAAGLLKDEPIAFHDFAVAFADARDTDLATVAESLGACLLKDADAALSVRPGFIGRGAATWENAERDNRYAGRETA